jgi:hypothetical protein
MTTTQSFRIYEVLQRHFKNNDDAKIVVQEIEQIIETKVENKSSVLFTKEDGSALKQDVLKFQIEMGKRFNSMIIWVVGTGVGIVALLFSIINIFFINK